MSIFNWRKTESQTENPTRQPRSTPSTRDFTDGLQVNETLTRGVYFGDYPGMKLASALAMPPVKIPVFFQGFPIPRIEGDDVTNELLDDMVKQFSVQIQQIHIQRRREGTIWVWPKFTNGRLVWEFIPDNTVCDIIRNIDTNEVQEIIVEENMTITTGYGRNVTVTRKRSFTERQVTVTFMGGMIPGDLKSGSMRNPIGMLPIPFACEADGDDIRGHSVYGRIISQLKGYHDTLLALMTLLSKFKIKLIQGIGEANADQFAQANGYTDADDMFTNMDISTKDLLIHRKDIDEKPELMSAPLQAYQAFLDTLKILYRNLVEGTGIPEITWGLKTEGNLASVEENMSTMLMYVRGDQRECTGSWVKLFTASLQLLSVAKMMNTGTELTVSWNDLDALSDESKSIIFKNFAEGLSKIMAVAGLTKSQLYNLWSMNFPNATEEDYEEFVKGIADMGLFKATVSADPLTAMDAMGVLPRETDV